MSNTQPRHPVVDTSSHYPPGHHTYDSTCPHYPQGHQTLAEIKLLGEDLLYVLLALHTEAPVSHHEVDTLASRRLPNKLDKVRHIFWVVHVAITIQSIYT